MGQSDLQFELAGSSRYPSSSYRGVRVIPVRVIGEFALSEFEFIGVLPYYYFLILKLKVALRLDNK